MNNMRLNSKKNLKLCLYRYKYVISSILQGTFVGAICSAAFTTWICVGKTLAQTYGEFSTDQYLKSSAIEGCPIQFLRNSTDLEGVQTPSR